MAGRTYVDTGKMEQYLTEIQNSISSMSSAIDAYSAKAPSLGESTSRPAVEGVLNKIKSSYAAITPKLEEMNQSVMEIKNEYVTRDATLQGSGGQNMASIH